MNYVISEDAYEAVCQERDALREIVEKQARMNRTTAKMALDLDKAIEERDRWEDQYRDLESAMDVMEEQYLIVERDLRGELAIVKADRDRLQQAYNAMSRDLQTMFNRMTEAQNKLAEMVKKASEKCETCVHYNNSIGDMVCHTCHGKNRWELGVK